MAEIKVLGVNLKVEEKERKLIAEVTRDAKLDSGRITPKLNDWERGFIESLSHGAANSVHFDVYWSPKQQETLKKIEGKLYS